MYFLIDFENVGSEGLKGAEYMQTEKDRKEWSGFLHSHKGRGDLWERVFGKGGHCQQRPGIYGGEGLLEKGSGKKILYLDSVKTFGKKDGLEIYRRMKRVAG